ncbi:hypothetical protein [Marinoscillum sp. MHG1-6]|uniref:DoxX family protein n=1 Tax=Marinoscillum sp. MHG1-6 TaxID=2959627 RepID=UPI002157F83F|nr:hypothetical protein [Marinoscillum sp. MHG1-6]
MKPFILLIIVFLLALGVIKLSSGQFNAALAGRIAMACMLVFTAIGHFAFTDGMAAMIPDFLPYKTELVFATGIAELLFAIGLLLPNFTGYTGWLLIMFFILILPANVKAAIDGVNYQTGELTGPGLTYLWFRIPLQLLFIAWVYFSAVRS